MPGIADSQYLRADQYRDDANLNARIDLHARFSANPYGWHPFVFDQFDLPPAARVLEVGCGPGRLWVENAARIPPGWALTLVDFSPGMVSAARQNLAGRGHAVRYAVADAQTLPFPAGTVDAVVANHMLYHVPDRARALADFRRVLRPGGRLYAATNGPAHLQELHDLLVPFDSALGLWSRAPDSVGPGGGRAFDLEPGAREVGCFFTDVAIRRYPDRLVVTEAEPLIAYVLSSAAGTALGPARVPAFRRYVEQELAARGAIEITKDSGLIVARREEE